jgi:hypothetical protein
VFKFSDIMPFDLELNSVGSLDAKIFLKTNRAGCRTALCKPETELNHMKKCYK